MRERHVVIDRGSYPESRPFVLTETVDASECNYLTSDRIAVLSVEDALMDPEFRDVVEAWRRGDDSAWHEEHMRLLAQWEAEDVIEDAQFRARGLVAVQTPDQAAFSPRAYQWVDPQTADALEAEGVARRVDT